jgi:very-short-patch-repair endonuclease
MNEPDDLLDPLRNMHPIGRLLAPVMQRAAYAYELGGECESPIEVILGAQIKMRADELESIVFEPQYVWRRYRIDWAALRKDDRKPLAFIECDGKDFHTSEEQVSRDRKRDAACAEAGIQVFRFTGSDINRNVEFCVDLVFTHLREQQCR